MLHAADVEAIQELKKKAEEEAMKRRELENKVTKASSILQDKVAAWNVVERQLKVGKLQLKMVCFSEVDVQSTSAIRLRMYLERNLWLIASCHLCQGGFASRLFV